MPTAKEPIDGTRVLTLLVHWPMVELELRETHWGGKQDDDDDDDDGLLLSL